MTVAEFTRFWDECNQLIKTGQFESAQKKLKALNVREVPKGLIKNLCGLYRRAHLWKLSLATLKPVVRPTMRSAKSKANVGEKIEYAFALQRAGVYYESADLLNEPEVQRDPQSLLARAFLEIFHWNYQEASTLLADYLKSDGVPPYEILIARVNFLACQTFLRSSDFFTHFENLKKDLRGSEHRLLLGAVLEIGAQYMVMHHDWGAADQALSEAQTLLSGEHNIHLMFVDKWRTIATALKTKSVKPLDAFRASALQAKHWETLRDLDYFRALLEPESVWANWVYYGTPYNSFRQRLELVREFPEQTIVSRSEPTGQIIDSWHVGDQHGEMTQLLLVLLLRDFYRPAKVGYIFSELFGNGLWNMTASQNRVHQLIRRLRTWMSESKLPFKIIEVDGAYALRMSEDVGLVCRKRFLPLQKIPFIFERYPTTSVRGLSAKQWAEKLNVTPVKARYLLSEATALGCILKQGEGPATRYVVKPSRKT